MKTQNVQQNILTKHDLMDALKIYSDKTDVKFEELRNSSDKRFDTLQKSTQERFDEMQKNTDQRFDDLRENLRNEINKAIVASENRIEIRMEIKLEKMELRIDDRARIYNSQILTKFDQWANDLKNSQVENVITADQLSKLRQDVDDIKIRIEKLAKN